MQLPDLFAHGGDFSARRVRRRILQIKPPAGLLYSNNNDGSTLFARGLNAQNVAVGENVQMAVSHADADWVVARVRAAFLNRFGWQLLVGIQEVKSITDQLPFLRASAPRLQVGKGGKGVFYDNTVYVIQNAHRSAEEVETIILHELYVRPAAPSVAHVAQTCTEPDFYD